MFVKNRTQRNDDGRCRYETTLLALVLVVINMRCIERKLALMLLLKLRNKKRKRKQQFWERSIIKARSEKGEFNLFLEMHANEHELFHHSFRMSPSKFDYLVERLGPSIQKSNEG